MPSQMTKIFEAFVEGIGARNVDTEAGIIRDVKLLGRKSRNKRIYTDQALKDAERLYEGIDVHVDHTEPGKRRPRRVAEGFGKVHRPTIKEDGVYGDIHYLKSHPVTPMVLERIDRPELGKGFGCSHHAEGTDRREKGQQIVESLTHAYGIDLVMDPATTSSLFEHEEPMPTKTIKEVLEEHEIQDAELLEISTATETPVEAEVDPEMELMAAFEKMVIAVWRSDADLSEKLKKIRMIGREQEKLSTKMSETPETDESTDESSSEGGEGSESSDDEEKKMEQTVIKDLVSTVKELTETVADMKKTQSITDLLEQRGATREGLGKERMELLQQQKDLDSMKSLLESWPRSISSPKSRPIFEAADDGVEDDYQVPSGTGEIAKAYK